ncbi:hypothetical protein [Treponema sp.]|uniref:hypothetical protein n=1 Tax=Treponema sp. TaxID=166 RepID=UPI003F0B17FA
MKKFAKISALIAALVLALAFVGCKDSDDDDDSSLIATFRTEEEDGGYGYCYVYFYDDNTLKMADNVVSFTGTYEGNPTVDGTITGIFAEGGKLVFYISGNVLTVKDSDGDVITFIKQ